VRVGGEEIFFVIINCVDRPGSSQSSCYCHENYTLKCPIKLPPSI
jgi:hypothetical protein